jgi:hypothetical protein
MFRSGSTWSFNVCRELVQLACKRQGQPLATCYFNQPDIEYFLRSRSVSSLPGPVVIKAHLLGEVSWQWIQSDRARTVITIRDLRDCMASDMRFLSEGFEKSTERLVDCLKTIPPALTCPNALVIPYEQMIAHTSEMIGRIAAHLGIEADGQEIREIDARTNMEASRKICQALREAPDSSLETVGAQKCDSRTLLHVNHVDSGKVGRWKDELSPEQVRILNQRFADWMPRLGYSF